MPRQDRQSKLVRIVLAAIVLVTFVAGQKLSIADTQPGQNLPQHAMRLAPDGTYVAAISDPGETAQARNLLTMRLSDSLVTKVTGYSDIDVSRFFWANDQRLVFDISHGAAHPQPGVYRGTYTIQRDGKGGRKLQEPVIAKAGQEPGGFLQLAAPLILLDRMRNNSNRVLLVQHTGEALAVHRLDVGRGRLKRLALEPRHVVRWLPDHLGTIRAAVAGVASVDDTRQHLLYRASDGQPWRVVNQFDRNDFELLAFGADNQRLIVASRTGRPRFALLAIDPLDAQRQQELVADTDHDVWNPQAVVVHQLLQTRAGRIVSYRYTAHEPVVVYFDALWAARQTAIDESLADTVNTIVEFSDDERKLLVHSDNGRVAGDYYIFDTVRRELKLLPSVSQWNKL